MRRPLLVALSLSLLVAAGVVYMAFHPPPALLKPGDTVPDVPLTATAGNAFRLSENIGNIVVLCFFATW